MKYIFLLMGLMSFHSVAQCYSKKIPKYERLVQKTKEEIVYIDSMVVSKTISIDNYNKKGRKENTQILDQTNDQIGYITYYYNKKGQLLMQDEEHEDEQIDSVVYFYDKAGNKSMSEQYNQGSLISSDYFNYDEQCRLIEQKRFLTDHSVAFWESTSYNENGLITEYMDSLTMWKTEFRYDKKGGQVLTIWSESGYAQGEMTVVPEYDSSGQLISESYFYDTKSIGGIADLKYTFEYDTLGRKVKESSFRKGKVIAITSWDYRKN